jgi:RNA polymerase sigma-70 factor (ECF subfamily)
MHDATGREDLTRLLEAAGRGDETARNSIAEVVYRELRQLAQAILRHERPHQTLRTTALVNEAWIRLIGGHDTAWENRAHFYRTAARAMRSILVDHARARKARKRGGDWHRTPLDDVIDAIEVDRVDLIALDEAVARLEALSPRRSQVVELRFFAGLSIGEVARVLDVSDTTVENDWDFARTWLHRMLRGDTE